MDRNRIENISKALADETRLGIFEAIASEHDFSCGDLAKLRGVAPATISHHLKVLANAELIKCRKEGKVVHSRTIPETLAEYAEWLARFSDGHPPIESATPITDARHLPPIFL
jgi:ArsR family transcriptional regulator